MADFDPDNIRVDLLKVKRKIYISYPEGSKERQDFLLASKMSELDYLKKLAPDESVKQVFAEYKAQLKSECMMIGLCLGVGACVSGMFLGFHVAYPSNIFLSFYIWPLFAGIGAAVTHVRHLLQHQKDFQPFKKEYDTLQKKITKLVDELKKLTK